MNHLSTYLVGSPSLFPSSMLLNVPSCPGIWCGESCNVFCGGALGWGMLRSI